MALNSVHHLSLNDRLAVLTDLWTHKTNSRKFTVSCYGYNISLICTAIHNFVTYDVWLISPLYAFIIATEFIIILWKHDKLLLFITMNTCYLWLFLMTFIFTYHDFESNLNYNLYSYTMLKYFSYTNIKPFHVYLMFNIKKNI